MIPVVKLSYPQIICIAFGLLRWDGKRVCIVFHSMEGVAIERLPET